MNITMVMSPQDDVGPEGSTWRNAALRVRCGLISEPLSRHGDRVKLVYSHRIGARRLDGSWLDGDVYVFYQTLEDYRDLAQELLGLGKTVVVDLCDDVFRMQGKVTAAGDMATLATAVTVPTESLARRLRDRLTCPIHVVPDAVEGARRLPAGPRPDGALRLFWYGWQHKCGALADRMEALARFAADRRRVLLTCITNLDPIRADLARIMRSGTEDLSVRVVAWRGDHFAAAFADTDLVLIPDGPSLENSGKSPIRLLQAFWAGRMPVVEDRASFAEFEPYGCLAPDPIAGIERALADPDATRERIAMAQAHIAATRAPETVARRWHEVLTGIVSERAVPAPRAAGTMS